jgi:hypothetical protein
MKKGNIEETPRCLGGVILLYLENILATSIHINKIELLVQNCKIQKNKHKQFENYIIFNFTHDTCDVGDFSIPDGQSLTLPGAKSYRNNKTYKKKLGCHKIKK